MAGLLETIARRLLSGNEPKKTVRTVRKTVPRTVYTSATSTGNVTGTETAEHKASEPIASATTEASVANAWVMNSTITESDVSVLDNAEPVVTEIDRTIKRERTNRELGREDYLLNQIDEFREKAQQLQELLLSKESKVAELQNIVDEREGKAKELESILSERQKKADGITEEMTKQIDSLIGKVTAKMDEIGVSIHESMNASLNASVSVIGRDITESRQLSEKQIEELQELKDLLATLTPQLETVKAELSDKVHTENVKCYRNISDLFKSMEDKMDKMEEIQKSVGTVRKCAITIIVFTVLNMLGLVALALYELGVFQMLLG